MYIQPNSTIYLCQDVPISPSYTDTRWFASRNAQQQYFSSKTVLSFSNVSYQRKERNRIKLQVAPSQMLTAMKCNYMWFKNTSYENKYWYAFVYNARYINDNTIEFEYAIDDIQTWCFDWDMGQCFIERQHSTTDYVGENIIAEPVECGEMVYSDYVPLPGIRSGQPMRVIIGIVDVNDFEVDGNLYGGVYGGLTLYSFNSNDKNGIDNFLANYIQKPDAVVLMYMCPPDIVPSVGDDHKIPTTATPDSYTNTIEFEEHDFEGYEPLNKKLYTYPYNYVQIDNGSAEALVLRYEFSKNSNHSLDVRTRGVFTSPVQLTLTPYNYKGISSNLLTEQLSMTQFPQCSWNTDAYKAWIAQNSIPMATNMIASIGSAVMMSGIGLAVASGGVGAIAPAAYSLGGDVGSAIQVTGAEGGMASLGSASLLHQTANMLNQRYYASIRADIVKGNVSSSNVNVANKDAVFRYATVNLNKNNARKIDNFFTMYGYAQQRIAIPNTHARTRYTYIKTVGCELHGAIPSSANEHICSIFDNGIRWWADDDVGDYWIRGNDPI